jgi:hypothetical protein
MNPIAELERMGLALRVSPDGNLTMEGLKALSPDQRERALGLVREEKDRIIDALLGPDPAALAHARRMLLHCPALRVKVHCWWCSRCSGGESGQCKAWHSHRAEVEFFRRSDAPYSLLVAEVEGLVQ